MSRLLAFDSLNNTRDLGGMKTAGGKTIRSGKLIRSGHLANCSEADIARLIEMVDTVVDLRTPEEASQKPDRMIPGVRMLDIPIIDKLVAGVTREEEADHFLDQLVTSQQLAMDYMCSIYVELVTNATAVSRYEKFLRLLMEPHPKAILWHCTAGKDRAGFGAILVEELLGVDRSDIIDDYLKTEEYLADDIKMLMQTYNLHNVERNRETELAVGCLFGARREFVDALYSEINALYGSFEGFVSQQLHITPEDIERLKELYLE